MRRSVNQPAGKRLSQTSRQPKQSGLRQPKAFYRPLTAPDSTERKPDADDVDDACASEGFGYSSCVVWKPSRIPLRDRTYLLVDTPTTPNHMPPNIQQEHGLPPVNPFGGKMDSWFVGSEGGWQPQESGGVRKEADLVDQVNAHDHMWSSSEENSSSQSDGNSLTMQHNSSPPSQDQVEVTPGGGEPALPIPTPSPPAERGTNTLGHPAGNATEV